ncbi:glycosyltransferase [Campylobacter sp. CCS1377]|uniref:Glycosyltransferase n=1 Tax=Campylobacter sp. CCS1377 TaxID=3158229 RepID=A0AAU7E8K4_9BACT|nr:glycosyltransferase [Campylobacter jejuni]
MKITFIISTLNSGGAERVLVTLANEFCKNHEVKIIKFNQEKSFYPLNESVEVKSLPYFKNQNLKDRILARIYRFFALRKAMLEDNADIFISFLDTTNIACIFAKWGIKTPLIISEHSHQSYLKSKIWRFLRRISFGYCNALCVLGSSDKKYYEKFVKNVKVLLNPCHFTLSDKTDIKKEKIVIFVGRLDENKNASMFIRAVKNLNLELRQKYRFCIAGEGVLRQNLENEAKIAGVNIEFLGRVEDMKSLYQRAEILCLCSFVEGLPTVLIESLFFDVLRISTDYTDGARDLIADEKDGFIVPKNDDLALSQSLTRVMENKNLREKILANASKKCKEFDTGFIASQWLDLIEEVRK